MNYYIAVLALFLVSFMCWRNPQRGLRLAVFFVPWHGLDLEVGVGAKAAAFFWAGLIPVALWGTKGQPTRTNTLGILFICWVLATSAVQIPLLPDVEVIGGPLRQGGFRTFFSMLMFLLTVSPLLFVPRLVNTEEDTMELAEVYVWSVVILCVIAWFQMVVFRLTGVDPVPIGLVKTWGGGDTAPHLMQTVSAMVTYGEENFFRPGSFGGEPKDLAMFILVALIMVQVALSYNYDRSYRDYRLLAVWIFLFATMLVTLSSSAYILFPIACAVFMAVQMIPFRSLMKPRAQYLLLQLFLVGVLGSLAYLTYSYGASGEGVLGILHERTFGRFDRGEAEQSLYYHEDHDEPIISFFLDNPYRSIIGLGLGNAHLYSYPYYPYSYTEGIYCHVAKRGYLRMISETGFIGLLLLILWLASHLYRLMRILPALPERDRIMGTRIAIACTVIFVVFLGGGQTTWPFFLAFGILVAFSEAVFASWMARKDPVRDLLVTARE